MENPVRVTSTLADELGPVSPAPNQIDRSSSLDAQAGRLIVNADDWGRSRLVTDKTLECVLHGTVSSVSAMVFMEDSERAATISLERGVDSGLHLNFTQPFDAPRTSNRLKEHQHRLVEYLKSNRLAQVIFHPGLAKSFDYVVAAQLDEFVRLYGAEPERLDGHHHMHLCLNVTLGRLLPLGTVVRRNFSFESGEKSATNRLYRSMIDRLLARRHRLADFFFSIAPIQPYERIKKICALAKDHIVEVETHAIEPEEHRFLMGDDLFRLAGDNKVARGFAVPPFRLSGSSAIRKGGSSALFLAMCALQANLDWFSLEDWC
jgi:chitin disaccharide deacetylase